MMSEVAQVAPSNNLPNLISLSPEAVMPSLDVVHVSFQKCDMQCQLVLGMMAS